MSSRFIITIRIPLFLVWFSSCEVVGKGDQCLLAERKKAMTMSQTTAFQSMVQVLPFILFFPRLFGSGLVFMFGYPDQRSSTC